MRNGTITIEYESGPLYAPTFNRIVLRPHVIKDFAELCVHQTVDSDNPARPYKPGKMKTVTLSAKVAAARVTHTCRETPFPSTAPDPVKHGRDGDD